MSDRAKRIEASTLRRGDREVNRNFSDRTNEAGAARYRDATEDGRECRGIPPVGSAHRERRSAPKRFETLYNSRASGEVCPKHRNSRRESAGRDRVDRREVFVLC
jgi:hypothetical protein